MDVHEWSATELCAGCAVGTSYPGFLDWQARATSFSELGAYVESRVVVSGGDPERVGAAHVSAGLVPDARRPARARPAVHRGDDRRAPSRSRSSATRSGSAASARDADILRRTIRIDGIDRTIVGVMPAGFRYPEFAHVWLPLAPAAAAMETGRSFARRRRAACVTGVTMEQARAEVRAIAAALETGASGDQCRLDGGRLDACAKT